MMIIELQYKNSEEIRIIKKTVNCVRINGVFFLGRIYKIFASSEVYASP